MYLVLRIQTAIMHVCTWPLYMVQNTAQINKKICINICHTILRRLKELFDFNKLPKLINMIIFRMILFYNEPCTKYNGLNLEI